MNKKNEDTYACTICCPAAGDPGKPKHIIENLEQKRQTSQRDCAKIYECILSHHIWAIAHMPMFFFPGRDQYYSRLFLWVCCSGTTRRLNREVDFWRSPGSNLRPLVYKASDLTTAPYRNMIFFLNSVIRIAILI